MLDIKDIRCHPDKYRGLISTRYTQAIDDLNLLIEYDTKRLLLLKEVEEGRTTRNQTAKELGRKKASGEDISKDIVNQGIVNKLLAEKENELSELDQLFQNQLLLVPNIPSDSTPIGKSSVDNIILKEFGVKRTTSKPHWEIAEDLGLLDFARGTKLSGSGFIVFTGEGAKLERKLLQYFIEQHVGKNKYKEVSTPFIVNKACMQGTGQLPKFEEDMYCVGNNEYLIPTAEVPITNLHKNEVLKTVPTAYVGYSPCFRKEAGSAGKDTRGLLRVHQFDKIELVQFVKPEESNATHNIMVSQIETLLQELELHYRVVELCTADLGFSATKCYDLEVWAPGVQAWLEVSSCSNFGDFQARRANIKYKDADKTKYCHTLNGSGLALPRIVAALLETHLQEDGTIKLPLAFSKVFGSEKIEKP